MLLEHGHAVPISEGCKSKRKELGMEEHPETVHKYKEGLEEVRTLLLACGFERLVGKKNNPPGDNTL